MHLRRLTSLRSQYAWLLVFVLCAVAVGNPAAVSTAAGCLPQADIPASAADGAQAPGSSSKAGLPEEESGELPEVLPGLIARIRPAAGPLAGSGQPTDAALGALRTDLVPRIDVRNGAALVGGDERIDFSHGGHVQWTGDLLVNNDGQYQLHVFAAGKFTVWLQDTVVVSNDGSGADGSGAGEWFASEPLTLAFGNAPLRIDYEFSGQRGLFSLYWQGPGFQLEPIAARYFAHPTDQHPDDAFERGRELSRGLRCAVCHSGFGPQAPLDAPDLRRIAVAMRREWVVDWLMEHGDGQTANASTIAAVSHDDTVARRMPYFALSRSEAEAIAAVLWSDSQSFLDANHQPQAATETVRKQEKPGGAGKSGEAVRQEPSVAEGEKLFASRGCLACHSLLAQRLGGLDPENDAHWLPHARLAALQQAMYSGGDLSNLGNKRPSTAIAAWLEDPRQLNSHSRMPQFELTPLELADLTAFLTTMQSPNLALPERIQLEVLPSEGRSPEGKSSEGRSPEGRSPEGNEAQVRSVDPGVLEDGRRLLVEHRCQACHSLPAAANSLAVSRTALTADSAWLAGCLSGAEPRSRNPAYRLTERQRRALQVYRTALNTLAVEGDEMTGTGVADSQAANTDPAKTDPAKTAVADATWGATSGARLLTELNCTACHARGLGQGVSDLLPQVARRVPGVAPLLAALAPPALSDIGDKLHDHALRSVITGTDRQRRPWLEVRMPKFSLDEREADALVQHLVAADRIPERDDGNRWTADRKGEDRLGSNSGPLDRERGAVEVDLGTQLAAGRLVTSDGFGCQSCHQIGKQPSGAVALGARGTDLTMLGTRVRSTWFERWVRNPVRIVPRMEMPAIQVPVPGVLDGDLDRQIAAVWATLNRPGFEPPSPSPVRIVRGHNQPDVVEPARVLTDVLELPQRKYLRPLIIGLGNRQNVLFDLESGRWSEWWIGDTARQLTRGKSWYWEIGAPPLTREANLLPGVLLSDGAGRRWEPRARQQFAVEFDRLTHTLEGIRFEGRMHFGLVDSPQPDQVRSRADQDHRLQKETSTDADGGDWRTLGLVLEVERADRMADDTTATGEVVLSGVAITNSYYGLRVGERLEWEQLPGDAVSAWELQVDERSVVRLTGPSASEPGTSSNAEPPDALGTVRHRVELRTGWPVDRFPLLEAASVAAASSDASVVDGGASSRQHGAAEPIRLAVVPGFEAVQLPLPRTEMPTALAWRGDQLLIGSLKGRVLAALDRDGDGWEDAWEPLSDDFPAPYGLAVSPAGIDVVVKHGVVRLTAPGPSQSAAESASGSASSSAGGASGGPALGSPASGPVEPLAYTATMVADGWGYTADYHDWAVGLPRDSDGNYYLALPCQQDDRSPAAARLRGTIQRLVPQAPTTDDPRHFRLETMAAGQRFPMGLAFNGEGELFATDNQGNYNPFNELNHLVQGRRYGFINKLEARDGFNPAFDSPAVNLPHPWTRSVNGLCCLLTPPSAIAAGHAGFGPFEGHLIGCEYNGLSLVRMSLQKVDGEYQGAAYLFSRQPRQGEETFEGPVVCAVSPAGDLVVGNIRDSGWGGGQNTGSIVRIRPTGAWPLGIREVRALPTGLRVEFTCRVNPEKAKQLAAYALRSYRRVSTPAYGGADQDERIEKIQQVQLSADALAVELQLPELRGDCVYELRVGNIGDSDETLHPQEAHYTMKRVPQAATSR
jgi:cbb3-type cytochrome oxidase cytochrome c subunit